MNSSPQDTPKTPRLPKRQDIDPKNPGYREQFGVIVLCDDEAHQTAIYGQLRAAGYRLKVVAT